MAGFGSGLRASAVVAVIAGAVVCTPAVAQTADVCPNGWSPEATVEFAPPVPAIDSGVVNAERADGCTLLDDIWNAEPFRSEAVFVANVSRITRDYVREGLLSERDRLRVIAAALRSGVGGPDDVQLDNSCPNRIAFTFDDGVSAYRPQTLQVLRDKQVHGVFYDNGFRVAANPQMAIFQVREGHTQLNHTYTHPHLNQLSDTAVLDEVLRTERLFEAIDAPLTFKGFRPPFFEANANVQGLIGGLGYTLSLGAVQTDDWDPAVTGAEIRDAILSQLVPGSVILLHDGPNDTPAGTGSVEALGQIIDIARSRGFCFGVTDHTGEVVASRYVSSGKRIPQIVNPVPYNVLVRPGTPPEPYVFTESPIRIAAAHSPATFAPGEVGNTLTLTVTNVSRNATDDSTVTVTDEIPAGLTATAAGGDGWTCSVTATVSCTRAEVLAPGAAYPPITITVDVVADAVSTTNTPEVVGHGGVWQSTASDAIEVTPPG
jgi:peptidoglycan/xylan/chitin deacetylase (PgdA/CDA1 family)